MEANMGDPIRSAVLRALRTNRTETPLCKPLWPMPTEPNVIPDPISTGDYGAAQTLEERIVYVRAYRRAITWATALSLRWTPGRCPVTPAHHLFPNFLPGPNDTLQDGSVDGKDSVGIIDLGDRQAEIEASVEAAVKRDVQLYVSQASSIV
jgi:hypothetical protein